MKKRVKFLYLFEGILTLITVSMIFLLVGCTKEDSGMDSPASVVKGEKIQERVSEAEKSSTDEKVYYGQWKIVDFLAPGITALGIDEMEGYMNVQLTYAEDSFIVDDVKLENPIYSETVITKEEFADGYNNQVTFDSLNISEDFVVDVSVSNSAAFGSMFYAADADTLYITMDGVFFKAERQSEADMEAAH